MHDEDTHASEGAASSGSSTPKEQPYRVQSLLCRRTGERLPLEEHKHCVYCFGRAEEVETGLHARFCGFDPERDPVHFGFPPGTTRDLDG